MNEIYKIYKILYKNYGPQGWWPILGYGYHKQDYNFPRNHDEIFEVCLGSILTQNTTFVSVIKSLENLQAKNALNVYTIEKMEINEFKEAIKPSGYYNQKARYILEFIAFYKNLYGATPTREELLNVIGIGEETADSILLYGYNQPELKVDAYTKRILVHLGFVNDKAKYTEIKFLIQNSLGASIKDKKKLLIAYQEFHALIVEHGKKHYSKKPYGSGCFLNPHVK
ncbi:endonuclease III domain-containing protein [Sulfurimonas sp.]|jgi:endonuclease-3 related protein|uniref:endonuclease III domain-containing protein n=1 Tax=Sulfurimonas sp. TaxID=2022749 RepID=UPI0025E3A3FE|nr:endonuclease III domain-containing protein [Sulfurimonas sp.]MCK9473621.1 endonuclease III domain-containing protein [Sulfurimonas sp.]MDD3505046.1 endonuclease III domain-containing protein [Sulfurimonas sp.]